ncbi:hypothetical protein NA57DRAFT_79297 [Rhizodiscina lignyota]|uniref:Bacteriocin-protection protein n=1 Tax=Rhizodiscina lignyota TaxID=1504668 RepID=A0A9P4M3C6_9PEZI|nr:hypothetical protein NA57DRAFT_79297 [Rhizodiscina lignyota]
MSIKALPSDLPIYSFPSADDFEAFLEREHTTTPGFHLKLAKKSSGIPSVSSSEAVEIALCFGWIDGRANGLDDKWWLVRYTPRRSKSIWSQKNVDTVSRLIEAGRMRPAGVECVEAAKADGRWVRAYAGPASITVPEDLTAALVAEPTAASFFESLNKTDRYSVLWRVQTASPKARANRIRTLVEMLAAGKKPRGPSNTAANSTDGTVSKKVKKQTSYSMSRFFNLDALVCDVGDKFRMPLKIADATQTLNYSPNLGHRTQKA